MPEPTQAIDERIQYQPPTPREINPDLAKHTIDASPLKKSIDGWYGGWRTEYYEEEYTSGLGKKSKRMSERMTRDISKRLGNDAGAAYCYDIISSMVGAAVSSSNFTAQETYNMYRGHIRNELPWTLLKKILFEGNPFEMKTISIPEIISNLSTYYLITKKGEAGWWLGKAVDQSSTMVLMRHNMGEGGGYPMPQAPQKQGIFDRIRNFGRS